MSQNAHLPVYPCEFKYINSNRSAATGLTKRELFAAMAMQGRAAVPGQPYAAHDARIAVDYADALLEELERSNGTA